MKVNSTVIYLALVAALIVMAIGAMRPQIVAASNSGTLVDSSCDPARSVDVSGAAVVYVTPDRALIQLGVQSNGASPDVVHDENVQKIQQVINAIRGLGVDAKDIATILTWFTRSTRITTPWKSKGTASITRFRSPCGISTRQMIPC